MNTVETKELLFTIRDLENKIRKLNEKPQSDILDLNQEVLSKLLVSRRETMKLNQKELSTLAGVALNIVKKLENKDLKVNLTSLLKVLEVLGIEPCLKLK